MAYCEAERELYRMIWSFLGMSWGFFKGFALRFMRMLCGATPNRLKPKPVFRAFRRLAAGPQALLH